MARKSKLLFTLMFSFLISSPIYAENNAQNTNKAFTIGKNYGIEISKRIPQFSKYSSDKLCEKVILKDIQAKNEDDFFISDILIKNYNEDFTVNVFKFCLLTVEKIKKDINNSSTNLQANNEYK